MNKSVINKVLRLILLLLIGYVSFMPYAIIILLVKSISVWNILYALGLILLIYRKKIISWWPKNSIEKALIILILIIHIIITLASILRLFIMNSVSNLDI